MTAVGKMTRELSVKIDTVEFNTAVLSVKETPTRTTASTTTASGETRQDVGPTSWAVDITYNAEWKAGSFHRLLLDNDGESAVLAWKPDPDGTPDLIRTATVTLVAPEGDATVGSYQSGTVSLPVTGQITTTDPA